MASKIDEVCFMRGNVFSGIFFVLAGILLALIPTDIFPVCDKLVTTAAGTTIPMKCFWTGRAELGAGGFFVFAGLALLVIRQRTVHSGIYLLSIAGAALALLFPTYLIGLCKTESMACRMGTEPGLLVWGGIVLLVSIVCFIRSFRENR